MPGLLTHLIAAFIGGLIVWFIFYRRYNLLAISAASGHHGIYGIFNTWFKYGKYALIFFVGHLAPDLIRFGVTGLVNGTLNFGEIVSKPLFWTLSFTHYAITWVLVFAAVFIFLFCLHKAKKIDKKKFKEWFIADVIFLTAIIIHLILDILIIEKSFWI